MGRLTLLRRSPSWVIIAIMAGFGFTGMASAQTITNTGPFSTNTISSTWVNNCRVTNTNRISAYNSNNQYAETGDASATDNTAAALPWTGWDTLDPAAWQQQGQSYTSWWNGVLQWLTQRTGGTGWNTSTTNLTWAPANPGTWDNWNPAMWQQNGQSFANWFSQVQNYLNTNSGQWMLTWPGNATGTSGNTVMGAVSGNAVNNYNATMAINIMNGGTSGSGGQNTCGFTPSSGSGGGPVVNPGTTPSAHPTGSSGVLGSSYSRGGSGGYGYYGGAAKPLNRPAAVTTPTPPAGGGQGGTVAPIAPASNINNTGPYSTNTVSSSYTDNSCVNNVNTVSAISFNTQSTSSGNTSVGGNTSAMGSGSGTASNVTGSDTGVNIDN